jgi:hypothetical protein
MNAVITSNPAYFHAVEVLLVVVTKNSVSRVVAQCSTIGSLRFGGVYIFHPEGRSLTKKPTKQDANRA